MNAFGQWNDFFKIIRPTGIRFHISRYRRQTRSGVRAYTDIRNRLEQAAGKINGEFADIDWVPIRYLNRAFDRSTLMGFFSACCRRACHPNS